jgi:transposase
VESSTLIALPWSNGQTEGQIARLKLVKRKIYGRGRIDPVPSYIHLGLAIDAPSC